VKDPDSPLKEQVNDLIRIAATLGGVAQGIQLAEALG